MVRLTFTEAQLQARRRALTRFRLLEMLGVLLALGAVASIMYLLPPEQERRHSDLTSAFYAVLARYTRSPEELAHQLDTLEADTPQAGGHA